MRLLCWNVRDLTGDPLAVHRVVRAAGADVVCLQEAPRRAPLSVVRLRFLERGTGLRCVAGGRRSGGTAVFVAPRVTVSRAGTRRLPVPGRFARTRGVATAALAVPGLGTVTVASVHLPLQADLRLDHVGRIVTGLRAPGEPAVVAGDLNEPAGAPAWRAWEPELADPFPGAAPTFPARDPRLRIDAVLVSAALHARDLGDGWYAADDAHRASDHLPVLAEIVLRHPAHL